MSHDKTYIINCMSHTHVCPSFLEVNLNFFLKRQVLIVVFCTHNPLCRKSYRYIDHFLLPRPPVTGMIALHLTGCMNRYHNAGFPTLLVNPVLRVLSSRLACAWVIVLSHHKIPSSCHYLVSSYSCWASDFLPLPLLSFLSYHLFHSLLFFLPSLDPGLLRLLTL